MGDLEESYVTRKPMHFTLIVFVVILAILTPVYFYMKYADKEETPQGELLTETFDEVNYWFSPDSELTEKDKKLLFRINYEGNFIQWKGTLLECTPMDGLYKVGVSHRSTEFSDVLFMTEDDCTGIVLGKTVTYKMKLLEWKVNAYIGEDGELLSVSD